MSKGIEPKQSSLYQLVKATVASQNYPTFSELDYMDIAALLLSFLILPDHVPCFHDARQQNIEFGQLSTQSK